MDQTKDVRDVWQSVGETPLIRLQHLSAMTGCEILGKAEFLNPGGSVKDRAAKGIISAAERDGRLQPGSTIVEGTAGNTGIGLATLANLRGYKTIIVIPDNQSQEKVDVLRALGADVRVVPSVGYAKPENYYHQARRIAESTPHSLWADQFNNTANAQQHYETTGPEIWRQTGGRLDALVMAAGTGGTISGTSRFLKEQHPDLRVVLADPMGSALYSYIKTGDLDSGDGDSITEGIGIGRLTENFKSARIDDAMQVDDQRMIEMAFYLARQEGLLLGTSAALNCFAAARLAKRMGPGHTIVTILCDGGQRYLSRLFNVAWLAAQGLEPQGTLAELLNA
jgi:cysteine synthase A